MSALVEVRELEKLFPIRRGVLSRVQGHVRAVDKVSFSIERGEIVALVGESGSGKTTIGRLLLRLIDATSGSVRFDDQELVGLDRLAMRALRRRMQIVFQDPFASLDPRMNVGSIVGEAFEIHGLAKGSQRREAIAGLLEQVGLSADAMRRYPHEFSGGQRQRIGIARALAVEPSFLVADEPVSALDVSVQAQVVNLLQDLQQKLALTILFISHDLAVVEHIADRVIVLYLGKIMEIASAEDLYRSPKHPYTQALLAAIPIPDPAAQRDYTPLKGDIPSPSAPPSGCVFRTRCPLAIAACAEQVPALTEIAPGHFKACLRDDVL